MHRAKRTRTATLILSAAFVGAMAWPGVTHAQDPDALDLTPIDVLTFDVAAGAVGRSVGSGANVDLDLRADLVGARILMLGVQLEALRLGVIGRPTIGTSIIEGRLLHVGAYLIGAGANDSSPCAFPARCDSSTGWIGFGLDAVELTHDTLSDRSGFRLGEATLLTTLPAGYSAQWRDTRVMLRAGATVDYLWGGSSAERWIGRFVAGLDGTLRARPFEVDLGVRYRPSFAAWTGDFGVEVTVDLRWRVPWRVLHEQGDAFGFGVELGYAYWSMPLNAFGASWANDANHTAFIRLFVAPSLWSAAPPA